MTRHLLMSLSLASLTLVACSDAPTAVPTAGLRAQSANLTTCRNVEFTTVGSPISNNVFVMTVSGDLEGTATFTFDLSTVNLTGQTVSNSGSTEWEITGSTVPGLGNFTTTFDNRNQLNDRPVSPATTFENIGRHRESGGVAKARLSYLGAFNAIPSPEVTLNWQGVICP